MSVAVLSILARTGSEVRVGSGAAETGSVIGVGSIVIGGTGTSTGISPLVSIPLVASATAFSASVTACVSVTIAACASVTAFAAATEASLTPFWVGS